MGSASGRRPRGATRYRPGAWGRGSAAARSSPFRRQTDRINGSQRPTRASHHLPAFRVRGKVIAGFAAFRAHLSYLPHSGSVFPELADELAGHTFSSGALRFPGDQPLPAPLVEKLIEVRLRQAFPD